MAPAWPDACVSCCGNDVKSGLDTHLKKSKPMLGSFATVPGKIPRLQETSAKGGRDHTTLPRTAGGGIAVTADKYMATT